MKIFNPINALKAAYQSFQKSRDNNGTIQKAPFQAYTIYLNTVGDVDVNKRYTGNSYRSYQEQVTEISKKYESIADWGNALTQNIIDIRAIFSCGAGLKYTVKDSAFKKEKEFIDTFVNLNDIDNESTIDFASEGEIEGKVLFKLTPNPDTKNIVIRHISWTDTAYKIYADQEDYKHYIKAEWQPKKKNTPVILEEQDFVYKKFSGRLSRVNETTPKIAGVLRNIEDIDKALWDLRKSDSFFAFPTPYFQTKTKEEAKNMMDTLATKKWNIGKALAGTAMFSLVQANMAGSEMLIKEISTNAQIVSGHTGIPIHYLGFTDMLSNRATADSLLELLYSATAKERKKWIGIWEEIFNKAMIQANKAFNQNYALNSIKVDIPIMTESMLRTIAEVYPVLYSSGIIRNRKTILDLMTNINTDEEMKQGNNNIENNIPG
jgi:hypothetical protein